MLHGARPVFVRHRLHSAVDSSRSAFTLQQHGSQSVGSVRVVCGVLLSHDIYAGQRSVGIRKQKRKRELKNRLRTNLRHRLRRFVTAAAAVVVPLHLVCDDTTAVLLFVCLVGCLRHHLQHHRPTNPSTTTTTLQGAAAVDCDLMSFGSTSRLRYTRSTK